MPIIGNGDIASALEDDDDIIFFASGVSNSQCKDEFRYVRERELLFKYAKKSHSEHKHLVYFSSLNPNYDLTRYYQHKSEMESIVRIVSGTILKIGNITWGKNPHTLINYLRDNPSAEIRDVYRYIITKEAFKHWILKLKNKPGTHNLIGETIKVSEIVERINDGRL